MPTGNALQSKVHYKGADEDFVVFVESAAAVRDWKNDKSIPLAQVVDGFKVFLTHRQGAQGILDTASKSALESEFGTHNEDAVIAKILEGGEVQETEEKGRSGDTNKSMGTRNEHGPSRR